LAAFVGGLLPLEAIDPWWSLLLGVAPPGGPDPIVFTPLVGPAVNAQWLGQRVLAAVYACGGVGLLLAFRATVLALVATIGELLVIRAGADARQAGLATMLILPTLVSGAAVRPQLLAIPLFALVILVGGTWPTRRWAPAAVAAITVLWANVHGSFVLAALALALLSVGGPPRVARIRLCLALVALVAGLVNPWGVAMFAAVLEVTKANGGGASSLALEWRPLDLLSMPGFFFLLQIAAASLGVRRSRRATCVAWVVLALPLAALGLGSGRHTVWVALATLPLVALALPRAHESERRSALAIPMVAALAILALVGLSNPLVASDRRLAPDTPVELADRAASAGVGRLFAFSDWGGYLAWRLRPTGRVFIDDRFEQHPTERWASYVSISRAEPGWQEELDAMGADALALDRHGQAPLVAAAERSADWRLAYDDAQGVLFVRR
jgi:hypothetical protein